jgi:hypothetical protein
MLVLEFMEKEAEKDTVVFRSNRQSRVTHPPVDIEIWQGSRITRPFVEPPERQTGLKIACKTQKSQNFRFNIENFPGVTPNFGRCRNVEMVFGVTRHTQCRFERNTTVILLRNPAPDGNPPMPRQTSGDYQITGGASYFREQ